MCTFHFWSGRQCCWIYSPSAFIFFPSIGSHIFLNLIFIVLAGFVFVCFMKFSPGGFQPYIRSFLRITMTTVSVNVVFVLLVEIWIPSPLALSWDLCFVHHLFDFMALPSLCLTGTVSITSMISFPYLLTFEVFERQVLFCVSPVLQLWFVPL